MKENWKTIEWAHNYQVSDLGRVKRVDHWTQGPTYKNKKMSLKHYPEKIIEGRLSGNLNSTSIYNYVTLVDNEGKPRYTSVHRLVAQAFVPNPENKREVDHIDQNPLNNRADNLRWVSHSENIRARKAAKYDKKFLEEYRNGDKILLGV